MSGSVSQISKRPKEQSIQSGSEQAASKLNSMIGYVKLKETSMRDAIKEIVQKKLEAVNYENDVCQNAVKDLSEVIKSRLKDFRLERHKLIVQVMIGEQKHQGLQLVNKCFWDQRTDLCLVEQFKNESMFCVVVVYIVYFY